MDKSPNSNPVFSGPILLSLSIGSLAFWFIGTYLDVYSIAFLGAIYELLWLPFLTLLFGLPVISLIRWSKIKFDIKSLTFLAFLLSTVTLLAFVSKNLL